MNMVKKLLFPLLLAGGAMAAMPASAANMTCQVNVKSGGTTWGNGTSNCSGFDYSFGKTTSGSFSIENIAKPVDYINWIKGCTSGTSCSVTVRAYAITRGEAYIHYQDGSIEFVSATIDYETGY